MSFRIYMEVKGKKSQQIYGNNEFPSTLFKVLKKQGFVIEDDYFKKQKITDLDSIIKATEKYIKDERDMRLKLVSLRDPDKMNDIADFSYLFDENNIYKGSSYTLAVMELMDEAYIFTSANILKYIGRENYDIVFTGNDVYFKLKDNVDVYMEGY